MRASQLVFVASILAGCAGGPAGPGQAAVAGPGAPAPTAAPSPPSPTAPPAPSASLPAPSATAPATAPDAGSAQTAPGDAATPAPVAPASPALALADAAALASQLAGLDTAGAAGTWLSAAGFSSDELPPAGGAISASVQTANLDTDPELESIAMVAVKSAAEDGPRTESRYLVWIDRDAKGGRIVGRKRFEIASCIADGSFALKLEPVHAAAFSDAIIDTEQAPECDGNIRVTARRELWTLERGKPELLASNEDTTEVDRVSHRTVHEAATLVFAGKPPKRGEIRNGKRVKQKLAFDAKTFAYR